MSTQAEKRKLTILSSYFIRLDGFEKSKERNAKLAIQRLGGSIIESEITRDTTVVIARAVGTKEFQLAQKSFGVPCVTLQWLTDCYSKQSALPFDPYLVPPFHGLTIVCTQIDDAERRTLKTLVEGNGGVFSNELKKGVATHLIAKKAEGEKYVFAKAWRNVYIVNMSWAETCARHKSTSLVFYSFHFQNFLSTIH